MAVFILLHLAVLLSTPCPHDALHAYLSLTAPVSLPLPLPLPFTYNHSPPVRILSKYSASKPLTIPSWLAETLMHALHDDANPSGRFSVVYS